VLGVGEAAGLVAFDDGAVVGVVPAVGSDPFGSALAGMPNAEDGAQTAAFGWDGCGPGLVGAVLVFFWRKALSAF
jgi:hypothetical protein